MWHFHHPVIFCAGHDYWRTVLSSKRFLSPDRKYRASNRQNHHMLVSQQDAHPAPGNWPFAANLWLREMWKSTEFAG
jgi:hypothetical protein